jgi:hypothetical protein
MISRDVTDGMNPRTSSTAVGPTPVAISLETFVTLVILGLSRPNILFIFVNGLIADTSGKAGSANQVGVLKRKAKKTGADSKVKRRR